MKHSNRRGYLMHELVWIFTLGMVLLGVAVSWISQSMLFSRKVSILKNHHDSLTRLAWDFRDDVRAAADVELIKQKLILKTEDGKSVSYLINGPMVSLEKEIDANTVKREFYSLAPTSKVRWDLNENPDEVGLVVERGIDTRISKKPVSPASDSSSKLNAAPEPVLTTDEPSEPVLTADESSAVSSSDGVLIDLEVRVLLNRWKKPSEASNDE